MIVTVGGWWFLALLAFGEDTLPSLRCGRDIINLGHTKFQVIAECGEPSTKYHQSKEVVLGSRFDTDRRAFRDLEYWLYNEGSRRFYKVLVFEQGRLIQIRQGDYGFDRPDPGNCSTVGTRVETGELVPIVRMKCGEPSYKDSYYLDRRVRRGDEEFLVSVKIDEWIYNFGPRKFMSTLRFEDGVLVAIVKGEYGY